MGAPVARGLNGWMDTAHRAVTCLERSEGLLRDVLDTLQGGTEPDVIETRTRFAVGINTDAAGVGQTADDALVLDPGESVDLRSFSATAPAGTTGVFLFYADAVDPGRLLHVEAAGQYTNGLFAGDGDYLPPGTKLVIRVEGMPINSRITVVINARRYRTNLPHRKSVIA